MRTIKFRGKRIDDGLWEYGWFYSKDGKYYIHDYINDTVPPYEVNPKTVGQYTGLDDVNGEEIYEGDIISGEYDEVVHKIEYSEYTACFTATLLEEYKMVNRLDQAWIKVQNKRVVGNIHDNPELLKRDEE